MTSVAMTLNRMSGTLRRIDRVVLTTAGIFLVLAVVVPAQALDSLLATLSSLGYISPFFVLSVLVAAYAKATGADQQIARIFSGRQLTGIVLAAAFGAFSPFCSCGVIPIIAGLLGAGVPLAPVMAFWISSPIMDPEMFILTGAVLGLPFATAKALSALGMGLFAGFATHALVLRSAFADPLKPGAFGCGSCGPARLDRNPKIEWAFWRAPERRRTFVEEGKVTGWFLFKWLLLAFVLESLMVAYLPAESVSQWLGGGNWWVIPASVAVGVPAYLNGYAAIPTVSALIDMGMIPGGALAFMVAGSVTSIPAAMAVFALVKRRVFLWYLGLGLTGSLISGFAYQAFVMM